MICHVHIPRCAGRAIELAMGWPHRHFSAGQWREHLGPEWDRAKAFAVVRNPWDRAFSWYRHLGREKRTGYPIPFPDWVEALYGDHQAPYYDASLVKPYHAWLGAPGVRIVRYETLRDEWGPLLDWLGVEPRSLERRNVAPDLGDWREAYTDRAAELVGDWHRQDCEHYGYHFEGVPCPA